MVGGRRAGNSDRGVVRADPAAVRQRAWLCPHYQFFPLVIPGSRGAGRGSRADGLGPLEPGPSPTISWGLAGVAWPLLCFGVGGDSPRGSRRSASSSLGGPRRPTASGVGGSLLAVVPGVGLPLAGDPAAAEVRLLLPDRQAPERGEPGLEQRAARPRGCLSLDGRERGAGRRPELLVDQACSGIYSLFTLLIGTAFYVLWNRTTPVRAAVLAIASVFWVLFGNVVRIVLVVLLSTRWGIDAATGWKHETLGLIMFLVMLGMVVSTEIDGLRPVATLAAAMAGD